MLILHFCLLKPYARQYSTVELNIIRYVDLAVLK